METDTTQGAPSPPEDPGTHDLRIIEDRIAVLMEHFDSVQVFATRQDGSVTRYTTAGRGNYCSRYGHVRLWVKREESLEAERE